MGYGMNKFKFGLFQHLRASNSNVNSRILPNFKFVQDFMSVLLTYVFASFIMNWLKIKLSNSSEIARLKKIW